MGDTLSNNWTDLDIGHGFHDTKQGARFTISEPARREVLQRLLKLNHERYAEEVQPGLHAKQRGAGTGKRGPGKKATGDESASQPATLFNMEHRRRTESHHRRRTRESSDSRSLTGLLKNVAWA